MSYSVTGPTKQAMVSGNRHLGDKTVQHREGVNERYKVHEEFYSNEDEAIARRTRFILRSEVIKIRGRYIKQGVKDRTLICRHWTSSFKEQ